MISHRHRDPVGQAARAARLAVLPERHRPLRAVPSDPSGIAPVLTDEQWRRVRDRHSLSPRQVELARAILRERSLEAVAFRMRLSLGTVKTYTQRLYRRMGVHDQKGLAVALLVPLLRPTHH